MRPGQILIEVDQWDGRPQQTCAVGVQIPRNGQLNLVKPTMSRVGEMWIGQQSTLALLRHIAANAPRITAKADVLKIGLA